MLEVDISKILAQLHEELDLVEKAIARIGKMGRGAKRARSRKLGIAAKADGNETRKASSEKLRGPER